MPNTFTKDTGLPASALPPGPGYILDKSGKVVIPGDVKFTYYPSVTGGKLDLFSKEIAAGRVPRPGEEYPTKSYTVRSISSSEAFCFLASCLKAYGYQRPKKPLERLHGIPELTPNSSEITSHPIWK